jgi:ABC-type multidrug transport system ATPase subunit
LSTQHIEEAEQLSNRILIIDEGKQIKFDYPGNFKNRRGLKMRILSQQYPEKL